MAQVDISDKVVDYDYPELKLGTIVELDESYGSSRSNGVIADYMSGEYEVIMLNDDGIPVYETNWVEDTNLLTVLDEDTDLGYKLINYFKFKVEPEAKRGRYTDE